MHNAQCTYLCPRVPMWPGLKDRFSPVATKTRLAQQEV
jgi:hypothetical protein